MTPERRPRISPGAGRHAARSARTSGALTPTLENRSSRDKRSRFHLHFTPTHGSWLNQVERWFGLLTERQLRRGSHTSVSQLKAAIAEFIEVTNDNPKPFKWTATADEILASIARFARRTLTAHGAAGTSAENH